MNTASLSSSSSSTLGPSPFWNGDQAVATRFFDALSVLLPEGEQFVIRAAEDAARGLAEPLPAVDELIADEQSHQRAHRLDLQRLQQQGGPAEALLQRVKSTMAPLNAESATTRLALACAFEHLTVLLSQRVLNSKTQWLRSTSSRQARMWRWHCAEEIAHGHVLMNLAAATRLPYGERVLCYVLATLYLVSDAFSLTRSFLQHDQRSGRLSRGQQWREVWEAVRFLLGETPALLRGWLIFFGPLRRLGRQPNNVPSFKPQTFRVRSGSSSAISGH